MCGAQVALIIAIFGWNWLRGPIERMTLEKTGRARHQRRPDGEVRLAVAARSCRCRTEHQHSSAARKAIR
jgi:hypothetical protein